MKKLFPLFLAIWLLIAACAPAASPVVVGDGNTTTTNVTITNVNVNGTGNNVNVGNDVEIEEVAPAATEAPVLATEAPAVETDSDVCFYTAWHDGWTPNGPERTNQTGTLSRSALEAGISLQAPWEEWTSTTTVDGYSVPKGYEQNNDAVHAVDCDGTVYMPARTEGSELAFWYISYMKLTDKGLLICENDINTSNHGWSGECSGRQTVVQGFPIDDISVPSDLQDNWTSLVKLTKSWEGPTPEYGTIEEAWTSTK